MARPHPILFLSDAPDTLTGLGRITRDLATLLSRSPHFRVATLGLGGTGRNDLPFMQYHMQLNEFGELSLPRVWDDFTGGQPGVLMTIWDLSRLLWLAHPGTLTDQWGWLAEWVAARRSSGQMKVWSYLPIDSVGPQGRLTRMSHDTLLGLDRLLAYTPFGANVVRATIGDQEAERKGIDWLPHCVGDAFFNVEPACGRTSEHTTIGCVATNQERKDWGLVAEVCYMLRSRLEKPLKLWWHTDTDIRYWSIPALLTDFGLGGITEVTHGAMDDQEMARRYASCDLTLAPGLGEGFGYPIFESLASGTPVLHGDYAGGASIMASCNLLGRVPPLHWHLSTQHNCYRPVFSASEWATIAIDALKSDFYTPDALRATVEHLKWQNLWPRWQRWYEGGLPAC